VSDVYVLGPFLQVSAVCPLIFEQSEKCIASPTLSRTIPHRPRLVLSTRISSHSTIYRARSLPRQSLNLGTRTVRLGNRPGDGTSKEYIYTVTILPMGGATAALASCTRKSGLASLCGGIMRITNIIGADWGQ
jgi:hypothetical protein